ncbi:DUF4426 domain-containing protein [Aestuariirhabdus sp. LZHN29]|uniref:DUF4426 domain-containing protein n=1 Tax=Aestuariirhabdus sp. LZHN29 TaxID=3417462 RepID=UPI003CEF681D
MIRQFYRLLSLLLITLPLASHANESDSVKEFDHHRVHYSVFNSTFLQPDVARSYGLKRGGNIGIVNIAVHQKTDAGNVAIKAKLKGKTSNLIQQQESLDFLPIEEGSAIYYLASFRFSNEEVLHYTIEIETADGQQLTLKFTHKLYQE